MVYRLAPNALRVPVTEETISEAVARLMETAGIDPEAEAPEALDAVELCWWEGASAAGAARALRQLADMCREVVEVDEESGERTVTAPRKIRALGVFGFSARCAGSRSRDNAWPLAAIHGLSLAEGFLLMAINLQLDLAQECAWVWLMGVPAAETRITPAKGRLNPSLMLTVDTQSHQSGCVYAEQSRTPWPQG